MRAGGRHRIEAYLQRLFGYAFSLTGCEHNAADLVQECALKALTTKRQPCDEAAYRAWLFVILRNAYIDSLRRANRFAELGCETAPKGPDWQELQQEGLINRLTVRAAMAQLPSGHREVIALIDIAGLSYREAADVLGVPTGTVMSRISRARHALLATVSAHNVHTLPAFARKSK